MRHLNIRNYRNFKESNICLTPLIILTGENNTGKTSLLKLIETISNNKTLNFQDTFFCEVKTKDILKDEKKPLEIFMSFSHHEIQKTKKPNILEETLLFEKYDITSTKDYDYPIIKKIFTWDEHTEELIIFEFDYDFSGLDQIISATPKIASISMDKCNLKINKNLFLSEEPYDFIGLIKKTIDSKTSDLKQEKIILKDYLDIKNNKKFHSIHTQFYESQIFSLLDRINNSLSIRDLYALYIFKNRTNESNDKEIEKSLNLAWRGITQRSARYSNFNYIGPIRPMFEEFYIRENFNKSKRNIEDDIQMNSIKIFFENKTRMKDEIDKFFNEISNIKSLDVVADKGKNNPQIYYYPIYKTKTGSQKEKKLKYSGTGVSQLFPIIVSTLFNKIKMKDENIRLICSLGIEQPELHLHPKAQDKLGYFFVDYLMETQSTRDEIKNFKIGDQRLMQRNLDKFIIIETHSTFIINGIRKALNNIYELKKDELTNATTNSEINKSINIIYLYNKSRTTKTDCFSINRMGRLSGNYNNYLDFYINDSFELLGI